MKYSAYQMLLFLCLINTVAAQSLQDVSLNVKVQEVTVFLNGAEIRHNEKLVVKKGVNRIIFKNLSPSLNEKSVQVSADNPRVTLLSVATNAISVEAESIDGKVKALRDTIDHINERIELVNNQIDAYQFEKKTLSENQRLAGNQGGVSLVELNKASDFFRERTLKINNALSELNKKLRVLDKKLKAANSEYELLRQKINLNRKEIIVTVSSDADQPVTFTIKYLVTDAGWLATYDIIAADIGKPVLLKYKARIYNATAIDWQDVKVTLSTGDPVLAITRPRLTAWTLNYTSRANEGLVENKTSKYISANRDTLKAYDDITVGELTTSFPVEQKHTIIANDQPYWVDLLTESLPATFEYLIVPKIDLSAFLVARVTGWEKLNLIDGIANVYFGNTYMGESKIATRLLSDTLEFSLGRDNHIVVSRSKLEDKSGTKLIGTKRHESFTYEIQIKNNQKVPVFVKIQDQVPVSQESDIVVDVNETSGADIDVPSGRLQWIKTIQPGETSKLITSFTVKYPKNKSISIRKDRIIMTPRYRH